MQAEQASAATSSKRRAASPEQPESHTANKRVKTDRKRDKKSALATPRLPSERHDKEFWYRDGTVIIRVGDTLFKLYGSRLERYCVFFQQLFAANSNAELNEVIDGCPVYHVPPEVSVKGFRNLIGALDTPMSFVANPPSQALAISLLYTSHTLACDIVLRLAKSTLCDIWDPDRIPNEDGSDARAYRDAIYVVQLSRQFGIPGVLKRAFYEIVSSEEYWEALALDRNSIRLCEADLLMLYDARIALGVMWREFVFIAPNTDDEEDRLTSWYSGHGQCVQSSRIEYWETSVIKRGEQEKGAMDPFRYDLAGGREKAEDYNITAVRHTASCA